MVRYFSVTVMGSSHLFKTDLTDEKALEILGNRPDKSEFVISLLKAPKLSSNQLAWVHKLALEPIPIRSSVAPRLPVPFEPRPCRLWSPSISTCQMLLICSTTLLRS
jgi:hypothetical protein